VKALSSRQNPLVARFRAVARGDDRTLLLLDGLHLVADALDARLSIQHAIVAAGRAEQPDIRLLLERLARVGVELVRAGPPVMAAVSPVRSPSAIVATAVRPSFDEDRMYAGEEPLVVVACDVQEPGNVGAIVRVADAAGAAGLVAAGRCADPFGWKALRGSMGSALRLPIAIEPSVERAVSAVRRHGCRLVATAPRDGVPLFDSRLTGALALLVGGEGPGLAAPVLDAADLRLTIPMRPPVESLNAAVAAALVLYEARRQRR
jgi:TrmH family RNA methyltransferase